MKHKENDRLKKILYFMRPLSKNKAKWNGFREFLLSPLHANSPRKAEILDCLAKVVSDSGSAAEKKLFQLLFPEMTYEDAAARRNMRTKLSPLLEQYFEYVALLRYQEDAPTRWRYVLREANSERWDDYFPWLYERKALQSLAAFPHTDSFFIHQMDLSYQRDRFQSRQKRDAVGLKDKYQEEMHALNSLYAINLLKLACNIRNQSQLSGEAAEDSISIPLLQALLDVVKDDFYAQELSVRMYYLIYLGLVNPEEEAHFSQLLSMLYAHGLGFGREEARMLFQHANNYCTRRYNHYKASGILEKTIEFQQKLVALYRFQLKEDIIFESAKGGQFIDHGDFKNVVVHFCKMGEFEFVEEFIAVYSGRIIKDLQSVARAFNLGILCFFKSEFESAEKLLYKVRSELKDSNDRYYALSVKGYYLRTLFELGKIEDCEREAVNVSKGIRINRRLPRLDRQKYLQFCLYLQALCRAESEAAEKRVKQLEGLNEKIVNGPPTVSVDWLLEKAK